MTGAALDGRAGSTRGISGSSRVDFRIVGRKKSIITAAGRTSAPRRSSRPVREPEIASVGDGRPYLAVLIVIDEAW